MIELWHWPLLLGTGLVAGFVDAIAGGGGLITLPVLLGLGLPPPQALGTNKLQATFGSASAAYHYSATGLVKGRDCVRGFLITLASAAMGTLVVQQLDASLLRRAIPMLIAGVALYAIFQPQLGQLDRRPRLGLGGFEWSFGICLGFYDGFFGPGTGMFWTLAYVVGLGFNLTRATGSAKVMNFASNSASLIVFILGGKVWFIAGALMGIGQLLGAQLGSRLAVRHGAGFIRVMFIGMALLLSGKLLFDAFGR